MEKDLLITKKKTLNRKPNTIQPNQIKWNVKQTMRFHLTWILFNSYSITQYSENDAKITSLPTANQLKLIEL